MNRHAGGCLCGAVRYEIEGELAPIQMCHCGQCRKAQGVAFATNIPVAAERFRLIAGAQALREYESSPGKRRAFCGQCGSPILSRRPDDPSAIRLRAGSLDGPLDTRPAVHIYTGSKANWWHIDDDLPQLDGVSPPALSSSPDRPTASR